MKNGKNGNAIHTARSVCAMLIICAGLLWCSTPVFGQEKTSRTSTERDGTSKKETTEKTYEDGSKSIETKIYYNSGKVFGESRKNSTRREKRVRRPSITIAKDGFSL